MSPSNNENTAALSFPMGGQPSSWKETAAATMFVPQVASLALKTSLGITVALYILNQSHLLPKPLALVVSKFLFYPTLPITVSKRIGKWVTRVDETLVLGGAPFSFMDYPRRLKDEYGVSGVINMCKEWKGPTRQYKKLGMEELYLPTTDHFEPSQEDLISALSFIKRYEAQGKAVYVHCRAGHGRSGAVAYAWLLLKGYPKSVDDPKAVNADLRKLRDVRKSLWKQPNLTALRDRLIRSKGSLVDLNDDFFNRNKQDSEDEKKKEL
jgi:atypical dual specificity phosphatase